MSYVGGKDSCSYCKHKRPKKDGWRACCDAFPDGIPFDFVSERDIVNFEDCVPGIGFVPDVEAQKRSGYLK